MTMISQLIFMIFVLFASSIDTSLASIEGVPGTERMKAYYYKIGLALEQYLSRSYIAIKCSLKPSLNYFPL
jgi:hypothetical protein